MSAGAGSPAPVVVPDQRRAATLIQAAWRGTRTRMLVKRYVMLMMIQGFERANPTVLEFVARTPLNME